MRHSITFHNVQLFACVMNVLFMSSYSHATLNRGCVLCKMVPMKATLILSLIIICLVVHVLLLKSYSFVSLKI